MYIAFTFALLIVCLFVFVYVDVIDVNSLLLTFGHVILHSLLHCAFCKCLCLYCTSLYLYFVYV